MAIIVEMRILPRLSKPRLARTKGFIKLFLRFTRMD